MKVLHSKAIEVLVITLLTCLVLICATDLFGLAAAEAPGSGQTEVVVVATQHFITDMPEDCTPGHVRALLEKISPEILAVEAPTNVPDPWAFAPFDLSNVTRPWTEYV